MSLKKYISPEFQWLYVTMLEDTLSTSMPDDPEQGDGEDDIFGDETDNGEDPIGGIVGGGGFEDWDDEDPGVDSDFW